MPPLLVLVFPCTLVLDVWHERHEACSLDRLREITLLLGLEAGAATTIHTSVWVHMSAETRDVFVINMIDGLLLFFHDCVLDE